MKSIIIYDWMLKHPDLNGYKLLIFAVVYHFTSLGSGCFIGLKSWLDLLDCSRSQFFKARTELVSLGLLDFKDGCSLFCTVSGCDLALTIPDFEKVEATVPYEAELTWEQLMRKLCSDDFQSDNETAESENETAESENETLLY